MKNIYLRIICALLIACVLFATASCGGNDPANVDSSDATQNSSALENTTEAPETEPQKPDPVSFDLTSEYKLVRPDGTDATEIQALQLLYRGIKSAYGFDCEMLTDITQRGAEVKPNKFEILIGATNRNESQEASPNLPYYDWTYEIVSENVIVICGGSPESTMTAVRAFLSDVIGYQENAEDGTVISSGSVVPCERS